MKEMKVFRAITAVLSFALGFALCGIDHERRLANSEAAAYEATIEEMAQEASIGEAVENYILDVILESDFPDNLTSEQWDVWDSLAVRPSGELEVWLLNEYINYIKKL